MFRKKQFLLSLVFFVLLNIFLYVFVLIGHKEVPFNTKGYSTAHHYMVDPRRYPDIFPDEFIFLRSLDVWDAQWYIKIAEVGYPRKEKKFYDGSVMGKLTYAFFPLYPSTLFLMNLIFHDIELTAFLVANLLLLANFFSLYYVVSKLYTEAVATKTVWLLFLFPWAVFYRSYYTEGVFLLLLTWFSYFLIRKKWFFSTIFAAFLFVTRPNGIVMAGILFFSLFRALRAKKLHPAKLLAYSGISLSLFLGWLYLCFVQAGDAFFWMEVQKVWYKSSGIAETFVHNMATYFSFYDLPFHEQRKSKIDTAMIVILAVMLITSKKYLKPQLWWISFFIWLVPLLTKDTMSFTRYQIISFPIFIYLAHVLRGVWFGVVCGIFGALLFITMLFLVNWRWIG